MIWLERIYHNGSKDLHYMARKGVGRELRPLESKVGLYCAVYTPHPKSVLVFVSLLLHEPLLANAGSLTRG